MRRDSWILLLPVGLLVVAACGGVPQRAPAPDSPPAPVAEAPAAVDADGSTAPQAAAGEAWRELLPNAIRTDGGLLLGGQPTLEQLEQARSLGYTTVVNLRPAAEGGPSAREVEALGFAFHRLPIAGAQDLTEENARALAAILEAADGPTIVHCASGNRVGALLALEAYYVDGLDGDAAVQLGLDTGMTRLEPAVRDIVTASARRASG